MRFKQTQFGELQEYTTYRTIRRLFAIHVIHYFQNHLEQVHLPSMQWTRFDEQPPISTVEH